MQVMNNGSERIGKRGVRIELGEALLSLYAFVCTTVSLVRTSSSNDVINTATRCLANLGLDEANIAKLQQLGVLQQLTRLLAGEDCQSTIGNKCKQSILRGIRILCSNPESRYELKMLERTTSIIECLKSDDEELAQSALQALEVITQDCDPDALRPLCDKQTVQCVIRLCNHVKSSIRKSAINLLLNCTKSSDGRVVLSSAGGVETLVAAMESNTKDSNTFKEVVCGACICCREVVSRQRLRDSGGLEKLIKMLSQEEHSGLYHNIMAALVCYYFDENTLKVMVKNLGLLGALKHHLELMTTKPLEGIGTEGSEGD